MKPENRSIVDRELIAAFFSAKSKRRFRETGSYACEHATDLRNSECDLCLAEMHKVKGGKRKRRARSV